MSLYPTKPIVLVLDMHLSKMTIWARFIWEMIHLALNNNQSFTNLALYLWLIYNLPYSTYQQKLKVDVHTRF
jgi:hypothetical protein